jgi:hypothetical protein
MVDYIEEKPTVGEAPGPDLEQIARDIEKQARIAEESGQVKEAANLRDWARELRQKSIRTKLDPRT